MTRAITRMRTFSRVRPQPRGNSLPARAFKRAGWRWASPTRNPFRAEIFSDSHTDSWLTGASAGFKNIHHERHERAHQSRGLSIRQFSQISKIPCASRVACVAFAGAPFRRAFRTEPHRGRSVALLDDLGLWTAALLPVTGGLVVNGEPRDMEGAPVRRARLDRRARAHRTAG